MKIFLFLVLIVQAQILAAKNYDHSLSLVCSSEETLDVYTINTSFAKTYVVRSSEATFLVDTGNNTSWRKIRKVLKKLDLWKKLDAIALTHSHFDHAGSAAKLSELTGAVIVHHELESPILSLGETDVGQIRNWHWADASLIPLIKRLFRFWPVVDQVAFAGESIDFVDLDLNFGSDLMIQATHRSGHTPGSITIDISCAEKTVSFAGDLLTYRGGKIAMQKNFAHDWAKTNTSFDKYIREDFDFIFPAHGKPYARAESHQGYLRK